MSNDRLVDWFEPARMAGCHNITGKPTPISPAEDVLAATRANRRFAKWRERHAFPLADFMPGTGGQKWWLTNVKAFFRARAGMEQAPVPPAEKRGRGRPKKKPDSRSSANQAETSPRLKEAGHKSLHHSKRDVNRKDDAVRNDA